MKKMILSTFAAIMLITLSPLQAKAVAGPLPMTTTTKVVNESTEAQAMEARLNEIKAMDIKSLTSAERKQLRQEVKGMKSQMKSSDGVYLSVGAIVIIALLLILLL